MKSILFPVVMVAAFFNAFEAKAHSASQEEYEQVVKGVQTFEQSADYQPEILSTSKPNDIIYGDINAPIRIVEYASLSCGACKNFAENIMPEIKEKYVDTKKAYVVYRHYALNTAALHGSAVVDCVSGAENKQKLVADLFKVQEKWAFARMDSEVKNSLKIISKPYLSDEQFAKCYDDDKNQEAILLDMKQAADGLMITSTPSIFINGKRFLGAGKEELLAYIEEQSKK